MRLLIYLLALVSGFSAADRVRAEVTPASSVAQAAVAVADSFLAQDELREHIPADDEPDETRCPDQPLPFAAPRVGSPVALHDRARE